MAELARAVARAAPTPAARLERAELVAAAVTTAGDVRTAARAAMPPISELEARAAAVVTDARVVTMVLADACARADGTTTAVRACATATATPDAPGAAVRTWPKLTEAAPRATFCDVTEGAGTRTAPRSRVEAVANAVARGADNATCARAVAPPACPVATARVLPVMTEAADTAGTTPDPVAAAGFVRTVPLVTTVTGTAVARAVAIAPGATTEARPTADAVAVPVARALGAAMAARLITRLAAAVDCTCGLAVRATARPAAGWAVCAVAIAPGVTTEARPTADAVAIALARAFGAATAARP